MLPAGSSLVPSFCKCALIIVPSDFTLVIFGTALIEPSDPDPTRYGDNAKRSEHTRARLDIESATKRYTQETHACSTPLAVSRTSPGEPQRRGPGWRYPSSKNKERPNA